MYKKNLINSILSKTYEWHNMAVVFQLIRSLERAYVISAANKEDINKLLKSLGTVRSLLSVQVCSDEEEILKNSIWSVSLHNVLTYSVLFSPT